MLAGMIVYRHRDLFATPRMVLLSGLFALAMLLLMAGRLLEIEFELPVDVPKSLVLLFACPFLMFSQASVLRIALENAVARHLGLTSYSIYLWQLPIIQELQERGWTVDILTLTAIVVAVSTVSYLAVERPFLTWFRAGQAKPATAQASPRRRPSACRTRNTAAACVSTDQSCPALSRASTSFSTIAPMNVMADSQFDLRRGCRAQCFSDSQKK